MTLDGYIVRATEKAVMLESDDHGELWIPRSVIRNGAELEEGEDLVSIEVRQWFADKCLPPVYSTTVPY